MSDPNEIVKKHTVTIPVGIPLSPPKIMRIFLFLTKEFQAQSAEALLSLRSLLEQHNIALVVTDPDHAVIKNYEDDPVVYVSAGGEPKDFKILYDLPLSFRKRWLHFASIAEISPENLAQCWLAATDPLHAVVEMPPIKLSDTPLVSIFTAAYQSGSKILRPYKSLLNQTYASWEWVIVDDSDDAGSNYREMQETFKDCRIRLISPAAHSGRIGAVKRMAAGYCRGEILVELDHDDQLTPDALDKIVAAFKRHPECGFGFAEAAEVYEENLTSHYYGLDAGFGYLSYWRQFQPMLNRFVNVPRTPSTNWKTVRHLVGLPNHPRIWTKVAYDWVGGHRPSLMVADDYDLIIRSLLCTRLLRIPHLLYLQYRNAGGDNQTFQRNKQIQFLCARIEAYYRNKINQRLIASDMPDISGHPYSRLWRCAEDAPQWKGIDITDNDEPEKHTRLFVFPCYDESNAHVLDTSTFIDSVLENNKYGWINKEIIAVGRVPEGLMAAASRIAPAGRLKWWSTDKEFTKEEAVRYGKMLCSGKMVELLELEARAEKQMKNVVPKHLPLQYLNAYTPGYQLNPHADRLEVLLRLKQHYGFSKYLEIGTDQDEIFSQINGCVLKIGVDPAAGGTHRMTSDEFFRLNGLKTSSEQLKFDLVLIDGLHAWEQVLRDFVNVLACLEPGGLIVFHDCLPFNERQQLVPRPQPHSFWTGDVWKALFVLRQRSDVELAVGQFDWGVGIARLKPDSLPFTKIENDPHAWSWQDYITHRDDALQPMSFDGLMRWAEKTDTKTEFAPHLPNLAQ